jgi:hypothetical protein
VEANTIIITAELAEVAAGAIAMGLAIPGRGGVPKAHTHGWSKFRRASVPASSGRPRRAASPKKTAETA